MGWSWELVMGRVTENRVFFLIVFFFSGPLANSTLKKSSKIAKKIVGGKWRKIFFNNPITQWRLHNQKLSGTRQLSLLLGRCSMSHPVVLSSEESGGDFLFSILQVCNWKVLLLLCDIRVHVQNLYLDVCTSFRSCLFYTVCWDKIQKSAKKSWN